MNSAASHAIPASSVDQRRYYRPELDTLRFLAFMVVFCFHGLQHDPMFFENAGLPPGLALIAAKAIQSGAFGVDLFFCLAAFLITRLLIREFGDNGFIDMKSFYIRRNLRIWPLYFFAVLIYQVALPAFGEGTLSLTYILSFFVFGVNWLMAFGLGDPNASHLWSISLEEQFYLVWPLTIAFFGLARIRTIAVAMLLLAAVSRGVAIHLDASPEMRWMNSFLRMDPLAVGALLAAVLPSGFAMGPLARLVVGAIGTATPALCLLAFGLNTDWDMIAYPLAAFGCGMMLLATLQPGPDGLLSNPCTAYLGKISYGLYVYHPISLWIAGALLESGGFVFALCLDIMFASLSYAYLEAPFLRLKEAFEKVKSRSV